jgi:competence ComEA-like helix-hairpin-helix protein
MKNNEIKALIWIGCLFCFGFARLNLKSQNEGSEFQIIKSKLEVKAPLEKGALTISQMKKKGKKLHKAIKRGKASPFLSKSQFITLLNTGNPKELIKLKGIGPKLAQKIIEYRTVFGEFGEPKDLLKVKGIGKGKLKSLLIHIKF